MLAHIYIPWGIKRRNFKLGSHKSTGYAKPLCTASMPSDHLEQSLAHPSQAPASTRFFEQHPTGWRGPRPALCPPCARPDQNRAARVAAAGANGLLEIQHGFSGRASLHLSAQAASASKRRQETVHKQKIAPVRIPFFRFRFRLRMARIVPLGYPRAVESGEPIPSPARRLAAKRQFHFATTRTRTMKSPALPCPNHCRVSS